MTHFSIDHDNNIGAFASPEEAAAASTTPFDSFASEQDLAELAAQWPGERLVAIWNSLPGATPVARFKDRKTAVSRIWKRIQGLDEPNRAGAQQTAVAPARKPNGGPSKVKANKRVSPSKKAPKGQGKTEPAVKHEGSKTAQVVALLQRKNGATLPEIMEKMGWQRHTVRGFMAGAMKKAGYTVESFKPEGGERTYRINQ
jgi:hypothetical protein